MVGTGNPIGESLAVLSKTVRAGTTESEGDKAMPEDARTRPIAIDANLFMRHGVRRFLCATQESAGSWVVVPAEAMRETCRRYHVQAGRFAKRLVEREIAQRFGPTPAAPIKAQGEAGARELTKGTWAAFERWVRTEATRNDSPWRLEPEGDEARHLSLDLILSGAFDAEETGTPRGDPLIVSQALLSGSRVVATGNMATVDKGKLNAWIARRKAENHAGYAAAPTPFVVTPDEAWQAVLQGGDEMETDWNVTVLCHGVCRPSESPGWTPEQCLKNLWRFGGQLKGDDMPLAAQAVRRTRERWTPRERDLFGHLEQGAWLPNRTRASEGRRIQEETPAKELALAALNALGEERAAPESERTDGPRTQ